MSLLDGLRLLQRGEWDAAHRIAQADETPMGSWLHGIVHMDEPDEGNSRYWYGRAGRPFPGMNALKAEMAEFEKRLSRTMVGGNALSAPGIGQDTERASG